MEEPSPKFPSSINAFVEKFAKMLRDQVSSHIKKVRNTMKNTVGNRNKIERIARELREKIKKKR